VSARPRPGGFFAPAWSTGFFWTALSLELFLIALLSRYGELSVHGHALRFVAIYSGAGAAYLLAIRGFGVIGKKHRPRIFWLGAIALRLAVFPMAAGDDMARYIWEGEVQLHGVNPYLNSPDAESLSSLRNENWRKINHAEWPAIYPPAAELLFAQMTRISSSPYFFKAVFVVADLLVCVLLLRLNTGPGRYRSVAWFAWNPLVVCAFAGAGHFDSLMLLAMTAAIFALHRAKPLQTGEPAWSWAIVAAVSLGLAIAIKAVPVFLLPAGVLALRGRSIVLVVSLAIPWLFTLPFGGWFVVNKSLAEFARVTRFNDSIWWFFELGAWPPSVKQTVNWCWFHGLPFAGLNPYYENSRANFLLALVVAGIVVVFRKDWRRAALWTLGAALLISPVLHPWYVTWILPLACWRRQFAWSVFALSVAFCLLVWEAGPFWGEWRMTPLLHLLVLAPPLLAWLFSFRLQEKTANV
jgi:hypothetical protein